MADARKKEDNGAAELGIVESIPEVEEDPRRCRLYEARVSTSNFVLGSFYFFFLQQKQQQQTPLLLAPRLLLPLVARWEVPFATVYQYAKVCTPRCRRRAYANPGVLISNGEPWIYRMSQNDKISRNRNIARDMRNRDVVYRFALQGIVTRAIVNFRT